MSESGHIQGLDGLRAVAILLVILCHGNVAIGNVVPTGNLDRAVAVMMGAGWIGVDLFFVISGFLITGILLNTRHRENYFRNFYIRRALRIFPLFYFYVALALIVLPAVIGSNPALPTFGYWTASHPLDLSSVLAYFYNFRAAFLGAQLPLVNHFWSLAVEEHFYFVWPVALLLCPRRWIVRICLAGCALSLVSRLILVNTDGGLFAAYVLTPFRLDGLLLGSLLAVARTDENWWRIAQRSAAWLAFLGAAGVAFIFGLERHFYDFIPRGNKHDSRLIVSAGIFFVSLFFAAIVAIVVRGGAMTRALENPMLRRIGVYSYGIYVYHVLVLALIPRNFFEPFGALPEWVEKLILAGLVAVVSFGVAALSYHLYERRFLNLKDRLAPSARPAKTVPAAPELTVSDATAS